MSLQNNIDDDLKPFVKSESDLNLETISSFDAVEISTAKGSISMLFANVINSSIAKCYELISNLHKNYFISTATGEYLDDIANRYSIFRYNENDESDESLRYRITVHNLYNSLSNFIGIRQRILDKYASVEDIKIKEYTKGSGSCTFIVYMLSSNDSDFNLVRNDIIMYSPPGVNVNVITPSSVSYKLDIVVECYSTLSDSEKIDIRKTIRSNLSKIFSESNNRVTEHYEYINAIKNASTLIKVAKIISSTIDEQPVKLTIVEPNDMYKNILSDSTNITFV